MLRPDAAASWLAATIPGVLEDDPTAGTSSSAKPWFPAFLGRPRGLPVEILTRLVTPGSFLAGAEMASAAILACCCLLTIFPATLALCCLAADVAGTGAASAKPWFASAPGAGGTLLLLDLGLEDAGRGGAGPTEACRTVVAMLESRTVVATDAAREGYRMVGATLGSRTVATLPALEGFLTVSARLGSLGAPFDLERADAGRAASAGAGFLSIDLPLLGMGASLAGGGRGGGGAKGADAAAAAAAGCARGPPGPAGGAAGTGT